MSISGHGSGLWWVHSGAEKRQAGRSAMDLVLVSSSVRIQPFSV